MMGSEMGFGDRHGVRRNEASLLDRDLKTQTARTVSCNFAKFRREPRSRPTQLSGRLTGGWRLRLASPAWLMRPQPCELRLYTGRLACALRRCGDLYDLFADAGLWGLGKEPVSAVEVEP
jgi:hypothetical protein